jgi:hypothetical protein
MTVMRINEGPTPPSTLVGMYGLLSRKLGQHDEFEVVGVIGSILAVRDIGENNHVEFIDLAGLHRGDVRLFGTYEELEHYGQSHSSPFRQVVATAQRGRRGEI